MRKTLMGGVAAVAMLAGAAVQAQETLTAVHAFPTSLIYTQSFLEFVDKVNERGEGVVMRG